MMESGFGTPEESSEPDYGRMKNEDMYKGLTV
jgi:hypothetical protein